MITNPFRSEPRSIILIGLMGAGKTCVGRHLARSLGVPFKDADQEIEAAAGCTVSDIFEVYGEACFREGERKLIVRLLDHAPLVLATGGGAFMDDETRSCIRERGLSVWLKADLKLLLKRITSSSRTVRPLLANHNPEAILERLMKKRYPVYAEADLAVETRDESPSATTRRILSALEAHREAVQ